MIYDLHPLLSPVLSVLLSEQSSLVHMTVLTYLAALTVFGLFEACGDSPSSLTSIEDDCEGCSSSSSTSELRRTINLVGAISGGSGRGAMVVVNLIFDVVSKSHS